jgi:hypothetical protein
LLSLSEKLKWALIQVSRTTLAMYYCCRPGIENHQYRIPGMTIMKLGIYKNDTVHPRDYVNRRYMASRLYGYAQFPVSFDRLKEIEYSILHEIKRKYRGYMREHFIVPTSQVREFARYVKHVVLRHKQELLENT